jgi:methyl-accepting chemotaxis protein
MTIRRTFILLFSAISMLAVAIVVLITMLRGTQRELSEREFARYESFRLADELRQSSDDLTRLARAYVMTGDKAYEDWYWEVLDVRNGKKPRPESYQGRIYWDLVIAGEPNARPRSASGATVPLQTMMKNIGFTDEEFAKLKEAQANSDGLVTTETIAMNAMKGLYNDGTGKYVPQVLPDGSSRPADVAMAQRIMHDAKYHADKATIMKPIDDFFVLLEKRTNTGVETLRAKAERTTVLLLALVGLLLAAIVTAVLVLARKVVRPLGILREATQAIAEGNSDVQVNFKSRDELGQTAASFNEMVRRVKQKEQELRQETVAVEQSSRMVEGYMKKTERQSEYLTKNVQTMLAAMERFKDGDMTVRLHAEKNDEIGKLFSGFNEALEGLDKLVANVGQMANTVAISSAQISWATDQMASSAEEQSQQVSAIATSIETMNGAIGQASMNIIEAAQLTERNGTSASEAVAVTKASLNKMSDIGAIVQSSAATVQRLGDSSAQIGEIISVIDEIADQTNLLALNAAIEAARAGEQGRGFAVVADEVRKLAERTSQATKQIGTTIKQIQSETRAAVTSIQRGNDEVKEGITLSDKASVALGGIVSGTQQIQSMIISIVSSSDSQLSSSQAITGAIDSVSSGVRGSAMSIRDISHTAQEMTDLTDQLLRLVQRFKSSQSVDVSELMSADADDVKQLMA